MTDMIDAAAVRRMLAAEVEIAGSQKAWATGHGVSPAYVNDVLYGRREPGERIAAELGLERVVGYRRKEPQPAPA